MSEERSYIAVFFDVDIPAVPQNANYKRLLWNQYNNLLDEAIPDKTVELIDSEKKTSNYLIVNRRIFHLKNSIDNTMFLICDVKKVK